ncbi:hypothetical protein [Streptomyces rhizosphaericus]|uniref:Uncharacterized protein n=1 Tax=Streptomyces rhizosphaericus TaxID=114699 RepID=A0A6G4APL9_9ACTN|nr:hypothetical protein [Streptomyces rhizosphaericus]NEW75416.1 hypothetical protein [Streptomyces rhizosphaericus]
MPFIVNRSVRRKTTHSSPQALRIKSPKSNRTTCEKKIVFDVTSELRCLLRPQLAVCAGKRLCSRVSAHADEVGPFTSWREQPRVTQNGYIPQIPTPNHYGSDVLPWNKRSMLWNTAKGYTRLIDSKHQHALPAHPEQ